MIELTWSQPSSLTSFAVIWSQSPGKTYFFGALGVRTFEENVALIGIWIETKVAYD